MNHAPGDPACVEHSPTGIYTAVVHVCPLCLPTVRQVGTKDEEMPCGCIPYEHETFGPCSTTEPQ